MVFDVTNLPAEPRVQGFTLEATGQYFTRLEDWNSFPDLIPQNLVGCYVNLKLISDPKQAKPSHIGVISRSIDGGYSWTNAAGESWTLTLEGNVLNLDPGKSNISTLGRLVLDFGKQPTAQSGATMQSGFPEPLSFKASPTISKAPVLTTHLGSKIGVSVNSLSKNLVYKISLLSEGKASTLGVARSSNDGFVKIPKFSTRKIGTYFIQLVRDEKIKLYVKLVVTPAL